MEIHEDFVLNVGFLETHIMIYRILPNKGAGRSTKVTSIHIGTNVSLLAFQRWFRIENRTIIKETTVILLIFGNVVFLQTMGGAPLLWGAPLIGRLRYDNHKNSCKRKKVTGYLLLEVRSACVY